MRFSGAEVHASGSGGGRLVQDRGDACPMALVEQGGVGGGIRSTWQKSGCPGERGRMGGGGQRRHTAREVGDPLGLTVLGQRPQRGSRLLVRATFGEEQQAAVGGEDGGEVARHGSGHETGLALARRIHLPQFGHVPRALVVQGLD